MSDNVKYTVDYYKENYVFMSGKKNIKLIYTVIAVVIIAVMTFFALEIIFPKAHSDTKNTTKQSLSSSSVVTETESETVTITKSSTVTVITTTVIKPVETKPAVTNTTAANTSATTAVNTTSAPVKTTTSTHIADDFGVFDNCAFIGNSRVIALKNYGLVKNAYAVVGLTVDTIFTKSVAGSTVPVIDELWGKDFEKVFIMLGDNECGWGNKDIFINRYSKVIDAVKERIPDAEIYLQSVLPVSESASASNPFGVTNDNINKLNVKIEKLAADYGIHYINPASALMNSDGALPDDAASDGIHLNKKYCKIWLTYIIDNVFSEVNE